MDSFFEHKQHAIDVREEALAMCVFDQTVWISLVTGDLLTIPTAAAASSPPDATAINKLATHEPVVTQLGFVSSHVLAAAGKNVTCYDSNTKQQLLTISLQAPIKSMDGCFGGLRTGELFIIEPGSQPTLRMLSAEASVPDCKAVVASPDGATLAVLGKTKIQVLADGGNIVLASPHKSPIKCITAGALSDPDCAVIVSGDAAGAVAMNELPTGGLISQWRCTAAVLFLQVDQVANLVLCALADDAVVMFAPRVGGGCLLKRFVGHACSIRGLKLERTGEELSMYTTSFDKTIRCWEVPQPSRLECCSDGCWVLGDEHWHMSCSTDPLRADENCREEIHSAGDECPHREVQCDHPGCGKTMPLCQLDEHLKTHPPPKSEIHYCPNRELKGDYLPCGYSEEGAGAEETVAEHAATCRYRVVSCPNGCMAGDVGSPTDEVPSVAVPEMQFFKLETGEHLLECSERVVPCGLGCAMASIRAKQHYAHMQPTEYSPDEYVQPVALAKSGPGTLGASPPKQSQKGFEMTDTDGDGQVSRAEWRARYGPGAAKGFDKFDIDENGSIDADEFRRGQGDIGCYIGPGCPNRMTECQFGCGLAVTVADHELHVLDDCPKRLVPCGAPRVGVFRVRLPCGSDLDPSNANKGCVPVGASIPEPLRFKATQPPGATTLAYYGCGAMLSVQDRATHEKLDCKLRLIECPHMCGARVTPEQSKAGIHMSEFCPNRFADCRLKCGFRCPAHEMPTHLENCPLTPAQCPYNCYTLGLFASTVADHMPNCPEKMVECPYGCDVSPLQCLIAYSVLPSLMLPTATLTSASTVATTTFACCTQPPAATLDSIFTALDCSPSGSTHTLELIRQNMELIQLGLVIESVVHRHMV